MRITKVKLSPDMLGMFEIVNVVLTERVRSNTVATERFSACDAAAVAVLSLSMYLGILSVSDHSQAVALASPVVRGLRDNPDTDGKVSSIQSLQVPALLLRMKARVSSSVNHS